MNLVDALVLRSLPRVGDDSVIKILNFSIDNGLHSLEELSEINISTIQLRTVPPALKELLETNDFESVRAEIEHERISWEAQEIVPIVLGSTRYPKQLLSLRKPPPFLFCKGNLDLLKHKSSIAVVGTRDNTLKGQQITRKTVEAFSKRGFSIVSGLALGIDAIAHRVAIDSNAPTIAVLVDLVSISPSTNRSLADEIIQQGGLWVAENPPGTKAIPAFFAKRDRIQAGLSTAVFAIETSIDGGTMHAVNAALEMRRPVFVPDAVAAGYSDLSIKAISGTQMLVNSRKAVAYTRGSYSDIFAQLEKVADHFDDNYQNG